MNTASAEVILTSADINELGANLSEHRKRLKRGLVDVMLYGIAQGLNQMLAAKPDCLDNFDPKSLAACHEPEILLLGAELALKTFAHRNVVHVGLRPPIRTDEYYEFHCAAWVEMTKLFQHRLHSPQAA